MWKSNPSSSHTITKYTHYTNNNNTIEFIYVKDEGNIQKNVAFIYIYMLFYVAVIKYTSGETIKRKRNKTTINEHKYILLLLLCCVYGCKPKTLLYLLLVFRAIKLLLREIIMCKINIANETHHHHIAFY